MACVASCVACRLACCRDDDEQSLSEPHFAAFKAAWMGFDPHATGFILTKELLALIQQLPEPMGYGTRYRVSKQQLLRRVATLKLPVYAGNRVHFQDVTTRLAQRVFEMVALRKGEAFEVPPERPPRRSMSRKRRRSEESNSDGVNHRPATGFHADAYFAAMAIEHTWQRCKLHKLANQARQRQHHSTDGTGAPVQNPDEDHVESTDGIVPGIQDT